MSRMKKIIISLLVAGSLVLTPFAGAVELTKQFIPGTPRTYATNEFIIAHESGNKNNTGANSLYNEVAYMTRNWRNAYTTHWVGSGGKVIQVAPSGYISWGAGWYANYRSYAQVELARTNNKSTFEKDYKSYVELLRQLAKESNIPIKFDSPGKGIKSHEWVADNLGGTDHRDPFSYLASWGISKAQFKKDIEQGLTVPNKPQKPQESPQNGRYTAKGKMLIKNSTNYNSSTVATYEKGQSFNYDKVIKKDGATWYSYISYSGVRRYVVDYKAPAPKPATIKWYKEKGTFYPNTNVNIRSKPSDKASKVGVYKPGESVIYDSYAITGGYVWIHYVSYGGYDRYMAIRTNKNGVNGNIWGYIK